MRELLIRRAGRRAPERILDVLDVLEVNAVWQPSPLAPDEAATTFGDPGRLSVDQDPQYSPDGSAV